jgi:mono/diheme cytochrome c family protein
MRRIVKWVLIVLGGLVGLLVVAVIGLSIYANMKFKPKYANRPLNPISADTSPEGQARGKYLMEDAMLCAEACHSPEGKPFQGNREDINQGPIAVVFAVPNLTPDMETGLGSWSDAEIARAIREGVDKAGVGLVVMPAYNYHALSDADVAAIVGYLRSLPPVHNEIPPFSANIVAKIMMAMGAFGPGSVGEPITAPQETPPSGTPEHGKYMVALGACSDCHKENLAGGSLPFSEPGTPLSANLTPAGELSKWTEAQFIAAVREGRHPGGGNLHDEMPRYKMTDEDLASIFAYLKTLPPAEQQKK